MAGKGLINGSNATPSRAGPSGRGLHSRGVGVSTGGKGKGKSKILPMRRQRKILKENILGITKPDIRRLARRGGVKRISAQIYSSTRDALKSYLEKVLKDTVLIMDHSRRKTVTVTDVIWALRRQGRPIYGFDADSYNPAEKTKAMRKLAAANRR